MDIVYLGEPSPEYFTVSCFLAGPSTYLLGRPTWRSSFLEQLSLYGYEGVVFVPEPNPLSSSSSPPTPSDDSIYEWASKHLKMSDIIFFWVDRDSASYCLGLDTNLEFGEWYKSGKVFLGYSPSAWKVSSLVQRLPPSSISTSGEMKDLISLAFSTLPPPHIRSKGERNIPLPLFHLPSFSSWLSSHLSSGNTLLHAEVEYLFRLPSGSIFFWVIHPHIHIKAEDRVKSNEFVVGRTDLSSVVLLHGDLPSRNPSLINVVLIREFRSPVRNALSFVYESPSGSPSFSPSSFLSPSSLAAKEVEEETGLSLHPSRLVEVSSRQSFSTLSTSKVHTFTALLSSSELSTLKSDTSPHGISEDSERTYIEVLSLQSILEHSLVDWSHIGMIYASIECLLSSP